MSPRLKSKFYKVIIGPSMPFMELNTRRGNIRNKDIRDKVEVVFSLVDKMRKARWK
ncbi:hypothetical protein H5410_000938 [Solanum commersonii]|uniref:Uncharacterized protein n=1 Tax=Solanum commersonii TaxID=4109 RepID=A0A9J6AX87_SOLCO|nr:hypothetical protein H5410_000938 [Solanum commersonii]